MAAPPSWFLVSYDHMYGGNAGLAQSKYLSVHLENNSVRYLCFRDVELVFGVNIMESTHRHLGNSSSVIAPALPYYTPSMVLCVTLGLCSRLDSTDSFLGIVTSYI
jgi:hypothetical protein